MTDQNWHDKKMQNADKQNDRPKMKWQNKWRKWQKHDKIRFQASPVHGCKFSLIGLILELWTRSEKQVSAERVPSDILEETRAGMIYIYIYTYIIYLLFIYLFVYLSIYLHK